MDLFGQENSIQLGNQMVIQVNNPSFRHTLNKNRKLLSLRV